MKQRWIKVFIMGVMILTAGREPLETFGAENAGNTAQNIAESENEEIPGTLETEEVIVGTANIGLTESEIEIPGILEEYPKTQREEQSVSENGVNTEENRETVREKMNLAMAYLQDKVQDPIVGTIGGEWSVLAMARYGNLSETVKNNYLSNLYQTLEKNQGILDDAKYTEYSRVILALTSMGIRPDSIDGYNLLVMLSDYENVLYQGINGPIFALLALDSHSYEIPDLSEEEKQAGKTQTTRENLIGEILSQELPDGGWALSGNTSDPDMTAMAIQALTPYRAEDPSVEQAVEQGLSFLSEAQDTQGGFASTEVSNLESTAQVLIALSGLDPALPEDPRFRKEGNSVLDALLSYQKKDGSFSHTQGGEADAMATDQGALALLAYIRSTDGQTALYDMTDVPMEDSDTEENQETIDAFMKKIRALPERVTVKNKDTIYQLLSELDLMGTFPEKEALRARLNEKSREIKQQEQQIQELDTAIWNQIDPLDIALKDKEGIEQLMERYLQIPDENKEYLKNREDLLRAEAIIEKLAQGILAKEIFENVKNSSKDYRYLGEGYTILLSGKNSYEIKDMNANVSFSYEENILNFQILEEGSLPGSMQYEVFCELAEGWYQLEKMEDGLYRKKEKIYIKGDTFCFQTDRGGAYRLIPVSEDESLWSLPGILEEKKKSSSTTNLNNASASTGIGNSKSLIPGKTTITSNMVTAEIKDNIVSKEQVEKIKGTEKNLLMKGKLEDGKEYQMILHGKDVKEAAEINIEIRRNGNHNKSIKILSENPEILCFQQEGDFPGELQVQIPVEKEDGEYLLFFYNEKEGKAEVVQKIEVKDKSTRFVIHKGGDYFIDTRAKAKSVQELQQEEDDNWETLSVKDTEAPEEYFIGQGETEQEIKTSLWTVIGVLVLAVLTGGILFGKNYLQRKREKGKDRDEEI